ncbi:hypothetical protein BD309DRAFT_944736 [Dichomitus squalens]|nr:hypothetical protein BD309DRAFT_944736 [Dichomitus squalens]
MKPSGYICEIPGHETQAQSGEEVARNCTPLLPERARKKSMYPPHMPIIDLEECVTIHSHPVTGSTLGRRILSMFKFTRLTSGDGSPYIPCERRPLSTAKLNADGLAPP